tara:strand:+ start:2104 stop:2799 length:696 start_codon:yes stop_codon:yes gene_type:complete
MASNQQVILQAGSVPTETCFESIQQLYNTFINNTTAYVAGGYSLFNYGDSTPSVDDQDRPWIRTIGGKPDRMYSFISGQWISKHPVPANSYVRQIWVGSEAQLKTYDGGEDAGENEMAGPFWKIDTAMSARFPVGVGDFAASVTDTGGEKDTTLEENNLPPHTHNLKYTESKLKNQGSTQNDGEGHFISGSKTVNGMITAGSSQTSESFTNLPPYYGVYFIQRTSRIYYTV